MICAIQRAQTAATAQNQMIGPSKEQVLACMGPPMNKAAEGSTEVWSYGSSPRRRPGSSRFVLRVSGRRLPDKGQFPKPFAKLLFAGRRAAQPQLCRLGDTLHPEVMRWSMEGSGFRFASRRAKLFEGVPAVHGVASNYCQREHRSNEEGRTSSRLRCHSLRVNSFAAASSASFSFAASTVPRYTSRFLIRVTRQLRGFLAGTLIRERNIAG